MESFHGFQAVRMGHELIEIPLNRPPGTFSPTGGEGCDEGAGFMGRSAVVQLACSVTALTRRLDTCLRWSIGTARQWVIA
jgi:hypothetical protein